MPAIAGIFICRLKNDPFNAVPAPARLAADRLFQAPVKSQSDQT